MKQEIVNNSYKLKIVEKNVNTITVNLKKNDIVEKEIVNLDADTKVYDRIGRMYYI
jgi:chaperonin cofactor prefoldin